MTLRPLVIVPIALTLAAAGAPALAQYKVVGPDGRVTYTDRPPASEEAGKVTPLRPQRATAPAPGGTDSSLPFELRQLVQRYPVTLYAAPNCMPCDSARQLLQQRGIPYSERSILTEADAAALERLTTRRSIPSLTVGSQASSGYIAEDWTATLDAAGYPRESRLPRNWQPPAATPLTPREEPPQAGDGD
jgi:glutaredoxin